MKVVFNIQLKYYLISYIFTVQDILRTYAMCIFVKFKNKLN